MNPRLLTAAVCALLAGFALAAQGGVNGALGKRIIAAGGHPLHASLVSFTVGFTALLLICLVWVRSLPKSAVVIAGPWWSLTGGLLGCVVVTTSLLMVPRVGALVWLALLIASQLGAAVLLDHFGWVGMAVRPVTPWRLGGLALIVVGVLLVCRK